MLRHIDLRGRGTGSGVDFAALLPRAAFDVESAVEVVRPLCAAVRERGEAALIEQAARFDGVSLSRVRVDCRHLDDALQHLSSDVRTSLERSIDRLSATCTAELPADVVTRVAPGTSVVTRNVPVDRVGLYVPAGKAPLVSSVVMNVVPARAAGVASLALASPPQREFAGRPHPSVLAACALLGVDEVYAAGGAGAFAMFAYGYDADPNGCRPVDLVTGPANVYGVAAKRLLRGVVGTDSEAGPTEIAILADDTADAAFVAADLVSQAEHDPLAAGVLVTDSPRLVSAVLAELSRQVTATKHSERVSAALSGPQSAVVLVDDIDAATSVVNAYAPEHLEIHTRDAQERAGRIRNAGAVFVGAYAPVSLGDYCAGSNHVLPTGRSARFSSGLSVRSFLKTVQVVECGPEALAAAAPAVTTLADAEDLPAHGEAVRIRLAR